MRLHERPEAQPGKTIENSRIRSYITTMSIEQKLFKKKKFDVKRLEDYGFTMTGASFLLLKELMGGDFIAEIVVSESEFISGRVIDSDTGEEYVQIRMPNVRGPYVGAVREAYGELLSDIADKCCIEVGAGVLSEGLIRNVLEIADNIPPGRVMSYGQIAKAIGRPKNARLIGKIMSMADRYGDHPCHRVVNHAGRTVPGWEEQRRMLEAEGVEFLKNGCVDMKKFRAGSQ